MSDSSAPSKAIITISIGSILALLGGIVTFTLFVAPLKEIPNDFKAMRENVNGMKTQVALLNKTTSDLTDATKAIAEIMGKTTALEVNVGKHDEKLKSHEDQLRIIWRKIDSAEHRTSRGSSSENTSGRSRP